MTKLRHHPGGAGERLAAVLRAYALMQHSVGVAHGTELVALVHGGVHVEQARQQLSDFVRGLIVEGAAAGDLRDDIAADELAAYCLHALSAAAALPSAAAVARLVTVTLSGIRRPQVD